MRIIVFILTAVIQMAAAAAGFIILLLSMNGFNERDATPGIYLYIFLSFVSALGLGLGGGFVARHLVQKRSYGKVTASAISVLGFSVLGGLILIGSFFAAIVLAEIIRGTR